MSITNRKKIYQHLVSSAFRAKLIGALSAAVLLAGCANYGTIMNEDIPDPREAERYSLHDWAEGHSHEDLELILTFSGGGTRAAALSYGVLQELRDTNIVMGGSPVRMLDEVDYISSVSGGSFTSAYYGLHGDGIFENYEKDFLRFNLEKHLLWRAFNPFLLFSKKGRTDSAIKYYQKFLFQDATFADMIRPDRPMIIINSSDLGYGIRFSFIQEYFDLLCSELSAYPVAAAVAASSAVPVLFNPVVVENYATCSDMQLIGTTRIRERVESLHGQDLPVLLTQLETYADKDRRKYVHFVDGGITDNLGLRAISDVWAVSGGLKGTLQEDGRQTPHNIVIIMVDAATRSIHDMDLSNKEPSAIGSIGAVTGLQLTRYDADSMRLVKEELKEAVTALSTPEKPVKAHFIEVSIQDIQHPELLAFFDAIPTSFALDDEQVDKLIKAGRDLLRNNVEFQQLLTDIENQ